MKAEMSHKSKGFCVCHLLPVSPLFYLNLAGDYQAGAWGGFSTAAAAAADGFHSNQSAATRRHTITPVCRSEGRSHDLHVSPETGCRHHGDRNGKGRSRSATTAQKTMASADLNGTLVSFSDAGHSR